MKLCVLPVRAKRVPATKVQRARAERSVRSVRRSNALLAIVLTGCTAAPTSFPAVSPLTLSTSLPTLVTEPVSAPVPAPVPASQSPVEVSILIPPTDGFLERITLKPFGIHITPRTSPVQSEIFSGYHTGADAEYGDVESDVEVRAIADGTVVSSRTATGYGGVMVIRHTIGDRQVLALYGHLRPSSMMKSGAKVTSGQTIAVLGLGFSAETSGERKHLHFAILKGSGVNIRGYVSTEGALGGWEDPMEFLRR